MTKLLRWIREHRPVVVTAGRLSTLRFRATWHCPTCTEAKNPAHDRNAYGGYAPYNPEEAGKQ